MSHLSMIVFYRAYQTSDATTVWLSNGAARYAFKFDGTLTRRDAMLRPELSQCVFTTPNPDTFEMPTVGVHGEPTNR